MGAPSTSASRLTPSWVGGRVKLSVWPKITGYSSRTSELMAVWYTSASIRKVAVSDQLRAVTLMLRPPRMNPLESMRVNGQGPAMQEAVILLNVLSAPASSETVATVAFHFPSGEHGER